MARVKVEPGGRALVAILIVGALLLLFIRVRASINKSSISVQPPHQSPARVQIQQTQTPENRIAPKPKEEESTAPPEANLPVPSGEPIRIFFDFNRSNINKNVYCIFDRISEKVRRIGGQNFRIMVEGNADSIGPSWYNVDLSRTRAVRVADSLSRRLGIPLRNIQLVANGSTKPATSNGTREGRAENRRTEVHIFY